MDFWTTLAQSQFWLWNRKNLKTKNIDNILVQGALRPSILGAYEYVFPEECLAEVLVHLGVHDEGIGAKPTRRNKAKLVAMRKLLGVKKIPKEIWEEARKLSGSVTIKGYWRGICQINVPGVAIHVIGYKKDDRKKVEKWGYEQEML